jgi:hypothetical protein
MKKLIEDTKFLIVFFVFIFPVLFFFQNMYSNYRFHKELQKRGVVAVAHHITPALDDLGSVRTWTTSHFYFEYKERIDTASILVRVSYLDDDELYSEAFKKDSFEILFLPEDTHNAIFKIDLLHFKTIALDAPGPNSMDRPSFLKFYGILFLIYFVIGMFLSWLNII